MRLQTSGSGMALLLALLLGLTACAGDSDTGDGAASGPATGDESESGSADADFPETIRVGVLDDLTGPAAFCGTDEVEGMKAAVAEAEETGFFGESKIELVTQDSASSPDRAVPGYQALVNDDVVGILGPCVSGAAGAIVQRAASDQIPIILTTSGSEPLADPEWVYRAGVVSRNYGPSMVETLVNRDVERTAVIYSTENPVHTVLVDEVFKPGFEEAGIELSVEAAITPDTQDLSAEIASIRAADVDAIGVVVTGGQNLTILEQLREAGLDQLVWGQIGMYNDAFVKDGGDVTNGVIFMTSFAPCFSDLSQQFAERFEEATGRIPGFAAAHGYDAAWRMFHAIKAAGSVDREAVNEALESKVTSVEGAQGSLTFDEVGNSIGKGGVVEINGGELECVS